MLDVLSDFELGPVVVQVVLLAMVLVGLSFWLLGRKMARVVCAIGGLLAASFGAAVVAYEMDNPALQLGIIIGSGIGGGIAAYLMFRIWMGVTGGLVIAVALPLAVIVWSSAPISEKDADKKQERIFSDEKEAIDVIDDLKKKVFGSVLEKIEEIITDNQDSDGENFDVDGEDAEGVLAEVFGGVLDIFVGDDVFEDWADFKFKQWLIDTAGNLRYWWKKTWSSLEPAQQRIAAVTAGLGAFVGLLIGLTFPTVAASIQSSLVGVVLMTGGGLRLLLRYTDGDPEWLPQSPRAWLLTLGLITLIGIAIQWTVFRKKADS